jgi:hypothetical protein
MWGSSILERQSARGGEELERQIERDRCIEREPETHICNGSKIIVRRSESDNA